LVDDQELFGEVGGVLQLVRRLSVSRVPGAEAGGRVLGKEATLLAVATASAAALAEVGNVGFGRYIDCGRCVDFGRYGALRVLFHISPQNEIRWHAPHPGVSGSYEVKL